MREWIKIFRALIVDFKLFWGWRAGVRSGKTFQCYTFLSLEVQGNHYRKMEKERTKRDREYRAALALDVATLSRMLGDPCRNYSPLPHFFLQTLYALKAGIENAKLPGMPQSQEDYENDVNREFFSELKLVDCLNWPRLQARVKQAQQMDAFEFAKDFLGEFETQRYNKWDAPIPRQFTKLEELYIVEEPEGLIPYWEKFGEDPATKPLESYKNESAAQVPDPFVKEVVTAGDLLAKQKDPTSKYVYCALCEEAFKSAPVTCHVCGSVLFFEGV